MEHAQRWRSGQTHRRAVRPRHPLTFLLLGRRLLPLLRGSKRCWRRLWLCWCWRCHCIHFRLDLLLEEQLLLVLLQLFRLLLLSFLILRIGCSVTDLVLTELIPAIHH